MSASYIRPLRRFVVWLVLDLIVGAGLLTFSVWADTSAKARHVPASGCYCCCGASKTSAGCAKMCELPKYASRWWAVTCAKPRAKTPTETPDAGPQFPHPSRSERASN